MALMTRFSRFEAVEVAVVVWRSADHPVKRQPAVVGEVVCVSSTASGRVASLGMGECLAGLRFGMSEA